MTELLHNPKIKLEHLARKAIVYLRQSSEKQVRQNKESQLLQYAMAERVRALGWQEIEIINNDLGSSAGLAAAQREGFERVLSSVALGEVGIVGSREVSRPSRTDKDWCRLLEVCQIFGTLIADEQQVYDAIGMLVWPWHSDLRRERVWHTAIPLLTAATGLAACLYLDTLWPVLIALCFALFGGYGVKGPFWALVSDWISPANKAAAIATVNSIASLSGFVGPFMIGYIKDKTGSYAMGTLPMILLALIGAAAVFITNARRSSRRLVAIHTAAE